MFYACNNREPVVHCFTYETARGSKHAALGLRGKEKKDLSDAIWETFDSLFKTVYRQGRLVEELEGRVIELERRLQERTGLNPVQSAGRVQEHAAEELPAERAA